MRNPTFLRRSFSVLVLGQGLLLTAFGCSSGGSGSTGGPASSRDEFFAQYCDVFAPCCAKAGLRSDGVACQALYGALAPSGYDAAAGNDCLREIRAASSSPTFCDSPGSTSSAPSCKRVFSSTGGTVAPGGICTKDSDCAASAEGSVRCATLYKSGAEIRKCQVQISGGKAGDSPCVGTVDGSTTYYSGSSTATDVAPRGYLCDIKDGVRCDSTADKCVAISPIGGACTGGSSDCVKDAFCDYKTKTCLAKLPAGSTCDTFGSQCMVGTYCDGTSKTCKAQLADGTACTDYKTCLSGSCVNGFCAKKSTTDLSLAFLCGK